MEVRRHWLLYARMDSLPQEQTDEIYAQFNPRSWSLLREPKLRGWNNTVRSAGPFMPDTTEVFLAQCNHYWEQGGLTFTDTQETAAAVFVNPILTGWIALLNSP